MPDFLSLLILSVLLVGAVAALRYGGRLAAFWARYVSPPAIYVSDVYPCMHATNSTFNTVPIKGTVRHLVRVVFLAHMVSVRLPSLRKQVEVPVL